MLLGGGPSVAVGAAGHHHALPDEDGVGSVRACWRLRLGGRNGICASRMVVAESWCCCHPRLPVGGGGGVAAAMESRGCSEPRVGPRCRPVTCGLPMSVSGTAVDALLSGVLVRHDADADADDGDS